MKKFASIVIGLSILASAISAHAIRESGGRRAPLAVQVTFGSTGSGIDEQAKKEILALIEQDKTAGKVTVFQEKRQGREGESTLCVEYASVQDAYEGGVAIQEVVDGSSKKVTLMQRVLSCSPDFGVAPNE